MAKILSKRQQDKLLVDEVWKEITYQCPVRGSVTEKIKVKQYASLGTEEVVVDKLVSELASHIESKEDEKDS